MYIADFLVSATHHNKCGIQN